MQRMLNELSKKDTEMCLCQVRKAQLDSKYSKSVQRPARNRTDSDYLKIPKKFECKTPKKNVIKEPEDEEQSPRFKDITSDTYDSPKKQDKMIIKKYPFDITKSIFSSDTYKTVGTQNSKIKFKKITTKEIKTPIKKPSHEEFLNISIPKK